MLISKAIYNEPYYIITGKWWRDNIVLWLLYFKMMDTNRKGAYSAHGRVFPYSVSDTLILPLLWAIKSLTAFGLTNWDFQIWFIVIFAAVNLL